MGTVFLLASALASILAVSQFFLLCVQFSVGKCLHLQVLLLTFSCAHLAEILWCPNFLTLNLANAIITIVTLATNLDIVICLTISSR